MIFRENVKKESFKSLRTLRYLKLEYNTVCFFFFLSRFAKGESVERGSANIIGNVEVMSILNQHIKIIKFK